MCGSRAAASLKRGVPVVHKRPDGGLPRSTALRNHLAAGARSLAGSLELRK